MQSQYCKLWLDLPHLRRSRMGAVTVEAQFRDKILPTWDDLGEWYRWIELVESSRLVQ